ncbi:odorant receptor 105-1 [Pimephales promelas]|nr:odorant receptor 105-1 [Pimephales promelas]
MLQTNWTTITEFIIVGFPGLHPDYYGLVAAIFFIVYTTTVAGNTVFLVLFFTSQSLRKPIYQAIMTNRITYIINVTAWVTALIAPTIATLHTQQLPYCGPKLIIQCYCDHISITNLACADNSKQILVALCVALLVLLLPLAFIIYSYGHIITSVMKLSSSQSRWKSFATCSTQLCITALFYMPRCAVYIASFLQIQISKDFRIVLILLYSLANETAASVVTEFFIVGFPGLPPKYYSLMAAFLLCIYIAVLTGNSLIVVLFVTERSLFKPITAIPNTQINISQSIAMVMFYSLLPPLMNPFIYCIRIKEANETAASVVTEFFIVGFPGLPPKYYSLMAAFLLCIYIAVLTGNSLIVVLFVTERSLFKPITAIPNTQINISQSIAMVMFYSLLPPLMNPFIYCIRIKEANETAASVVTEFFIVGFPGLPPKYYSLMAAFLLCIYIAVLTGNSLIVVLFLTIIVIYYVPRFIVYSTSNIPNVVSVLTSSQKIALVMFYSLLPPLMNPFIYCIRIKEMPSASAPDPGQAWCARGASFNEESEVKLSYRVRCQV